MDVADTVLLLSSSYLNVSLYTLELVLCRRYFERPNRPRLYKLGVTALLFFDTVCTLTICVNVILVVIGFSFGGNEVASFAPTSIVIFMTYCSSAVEQAILCHVFFTLTGNKFISGVLAIFILAHMGVAFASGALILKLDSELNASLTIALVSAVMCAATDLLIAFSLGAKVWNMLSPKDVLPPSNSFVRKFLLLIVSSGIIVASNTLIMMGLLLRHSSAFDFFFSCQGRVYSVTLLANFLVGIHFRRDTSTGTGSTRSAPRDPHTTGATGVVFDPVYGYDSESTSRAAHQGHGNFDSKELAPTPFQYPPNYGAEPNPTRLEHRPSLRIKSEP
ncbi:hypothetical protein C8R44DRAFT_865978 [Mycena epipterygia]|nr:hypothetical protein C8R44DRAFT_865978 [Mycena epipterygia]